MNQYYDPNEPSELPPRRGPRQRQSRLSIALEAAGGGLIIALVVVGIKVLLGL